MALGLSEASLIAIFMESVLFGGFSILFAGALYILYGKKRLPINIIILCVSVSMYTIALAHIIVNLQRAIEGFTVAVFESGGSDSFFNDVGATTYIIKEGLYELQTIIGDGFMIYRLYIVWSKDKRILIPGAIWMAGSIFLAVYGLVSLSKLSNATPIFIARIKHIGLSFYAITLGVNMICTSLIAYKIWSIEQETAGGSVYKSRSLSPVLASIIESGAIYSAALIALITTFASNSWGHYPVFDSMPQLIGIVFTLIIVRIALGLSSASESASHGFSQASSYRTSRPLPISVQMTSYSSARNDLGDPVDIGATSPPLSGTFSGEFRTYREYNYKDIGYAK